MKFPSTQDTRFPIWPLIVIASIAGGLAEIAWVLLYAAMSSVSSAEVAGQVTASLLPGWGQTPGAAALGIAIHLGLALVVGCAYALVVWAPFARRRGGRVTLYSAVATLAAVWAVNFLVVLPIVNPLFVMMMPYPVALVSKLLFALAMAAVLVAGDRQRGFSPHSLTHAMHP